MSVLAGFERAYGAGAQSSGELVRGSVQYAGATAYAGQPVAQTVPIWSASSTVVLTTTGQTFGSSIVMPKNQPVFQIGVWCTAVGTAITTWMALVDAGGIVRATSAAASTIAAAAAFYQSVLPANGIPYTSAYAGLYYVVIYGAATTTGVTLAATPAVGTTQLAGPPVLGGTMTNFGATPPAVGVSVGAVTGTTQMIYASVY